jgi:hypothetical protein
MTGLSKELLLLSLLVAPSLASINLPKHAAVSVSSNRMPILSKRKISASSTLRRVRSPSNVSRGRHSTAFIDPSTIIAGISTFYQTQPYTSAFVTCAVKGVAADLVAQKQSAVQEQKVLVAKTSKRPFHRRGGASHTSSFDLKRNIAFLLYSGIYQGMALELIYNTVIPKMFGTSILKNVLFSMFVVSPFLTLPMSYLFQALVFSRSPIVALQQYWADVRHQSLLKIYWTIWIPVQTIAFSIVPQHLRISFIAAVSFLWMILFSSIQSNK